MPIIRTKTFSKVFKRGAFELFSLALILSNFTTFGQITATEFIYDEEFLDKDFIEKNFEDGYAGYVDFFKTNLSYPQSSYKNKIEGLQLFYYDIFPADQKIEVTFLTLLDKAIEENIRATAKASFENWKMSGEGPFRIYQPVVYSMLPYYPQTLIGGIPELPIDLPLKFQQMFVLIKSKRIDPDFNLKQENDTIAKSNYEKNVYVRAMKQYEQMAKLNELGYAYDALNEMVRYNPLNKDLLLARIKLEQEIGINRYQAYDATLLGDFVDKSEPLAEKAKSNILARALDSIFVEGHNGITNSFTNYLIYPPSSIRENIQGVLIVEISGSIEKGIGFKAITKLDDDIEKLALAILELNKGKWRLYENDYTLYLPIFFSLNQHYYNQLDGEIEGFTKEFEFPVLEPIKMFSYAYSVDNGENQHLVNYENAKRKVEANMKKNK